MGTTDTANPISESLRAILEFSPPMALLVALIMLGTFLKRTPLQDWTIPLILMLVGGSIYPFIAEAAGITNYTMRDPRVYSILIGLCLGGAATGLHQIVKKFAERNFNIDIDTMQTTTVTKESVTTVTKTPDPPAK